jgi:hypothetical protein
LVRREKQSQFKANSKPIQSQFKANSNPKQSQSNPISPPSPLRLLQLFAVGCRTEKIMLFKSLSGKCQDHEEINNVKTLVFGPIYVVFALAVNIKDAGRSAFADKDCLTQSS